MKACIVTLVSGKHLHILSEMLNNLNTYFIHENPALDIVFFVEKKDVDSIPENLPYNNGKIIWHVINNFSLDHLPESRIAEVPDRVYWFGIGYRMMCRFFAGEIFKELKAYDYDFYLRLDADSRFWERVPDIFTEFVNNDMIYGYVNIMNDAPEFLVGMSVEIQKYISSNKINISNEFFISDKLIDCPFTYYNNFEVVNIRHFMSDNHMNLYNYLDMESNGFLKYRWGDGPFRYKYVNMYLKEKQIKYFSNVGYGHGEYYKNRPMTLIDWKTDSYYKKYMTKYETRSI